MFNFRVISDTLTPHLQSKMNGLDYFELHFAKNGMEVIRKNTLFYIPMSSPDEYIPSRGKGRLASSWFTMGKSFGYRAYDPYNKEWYAEIQEYQYPNKDTTQNPNASINYFQKGIAKSIPELKELLNRDLKRFLETK